MAIKALRTSSATSIASRSRSCFLHLALHTHAVLHRFVAVDNGVCSVTNMEGEVDLAELASADERLGLLHAAAHLESQRCGPHQELVGDLRLGVWIKESE